MPCNAHAQHRVSYGVDFLSGSLMSRVDMAWPPHQAVNTSL